VGKGKGKKGKRSGKPGRSAAVAKRPEAAVAENPAAASASPSERAPIAAPNVVVPKPPPASATASADSSTRETADAAGTWQTWLQAIGMRIGIYALFLLGAYCVLVALFSPWGFNIWDTSGRSGAGGVFWTALGGALLYGGWYLSGPDAPADGQAKSKTQRPRR
jgi:hypothetical protein